MANTPTTIAMYAAKQLGIGFSFTGHANDLFVHRSLLNEKLQRASFVACISDWHRRFYQSIAAVSQDKLPIIRCGVDIPPLEMSAQQSEVSKVESTVPFRILSVGRLVDKKGMDTLIRAIALIDPNHLIRCDIIGDGPLKPMLAELIETLSLRERVVLRGACPNTEVLEAVRQCDVFVLACQRDAVTDDQDGIPVSLMEAMARSKCVITTNLDPITELVIHERTGLTFPVRDPISLAKVLEFAIADSKSRFRIAAAGRAHIERAFSKAGNVKKLDDFFLRSALSGKFGSRRK
jgi:glycosyltransferase involved in cell wall biosynthesis